MSEERSIREVRLEKLAKMRSLGYDPFAIERFEITATARQLLDQFPGKTEEELRAIHVQFAGRVLGYRLMGKAGFMHLSDGEEKIQVYCRRDDLTEAEWELYQLLDIGDHVGVYGYLFVTKTGEASIHVEKLVPLSKSLQNLPIGKEKDGQTWYGLTDIESRYRHRHLDMICNPEARKMLIERCKLITAVRNYFNQASYLEVETPMLQVVAGGAAARPFKTYYNAFDMEVKLRISLELYLKRLICADIPRVYEIGRVFRNEGISLRHSPEFSLLEFYEAYTDLEGMMARVEALFAFVAQEVYGTTKVDLVSRTHRYENGELMPNQEQNILVDFSKPWRRVDMLSEIERLSGIPASSLSDLAAAKKAVLEAKAVEKAAALGAKIDLEKEDNLGGLIEKLLEVFVEPTLIEPAFVVGYPIETSPLAKKDPNRPGLTRRFEGYVLGREMCNAFSEINDPVDQKERFEQQALELAKGDEEAHPYDADFIYALEGGMPPTGGCGIGMERLAMVFTGAEHIREIMLFPTMKPRLEE